MRRANLVFAIVMAVFWIAVTSHCLLEVLPQLSFLACETEDTSGHCDDTTCEYVEAGNYKISKQVVYTPPVFSLLPEYDALADTPPL